MAHPNLKILDDYTRPEKIAFILLLTLLAVAPIPYGGVTQLGALIIDVLAFTAAALAVTGNRLALGKMRVPLFATAAVAVMGALQLVPLGIPAVGAISPTAASIYTNTNSVLAMFGESAVTARLSIAPTETIRASLLICAYVALFVTAASLARTRETRRVVAYTLIAASAIHVGYAAVTQQDRTAEQYTDRMHGLFVNPNHFAGYLEIALVVAFALVWTEVITGGDRLPLKMDRGAAMERRMIPLAWRVLAWVVVAVGIGFTKSRMGITAAAVTTLLLIVFALLHRRSQRNRARYAAIAGAGLVAAIALVGLITREVPLMRFLAADPRDPEADSRMRTWAASIDAWKQFPHFGSGLGTFREAFRRVQPPDLPGLFEQAHSDSLQLLVTGGWISLLLAAIGLIGALIVLMRRWAGQRHREESVFALAAAAALFSLLLHGIAEFNFSIPAIPATLAVILGVGWAAATDESPSRLAPEGR